MRGLCHKCHRSNIPVYPIDGLPICTKCNRTPGKNPVRHCADCKCKIEFKVSGMGRKFRCTPCSQKRRAEKVKGYTRKYAEEKKHINNPKTNDSHE